MISQVLSHGRPLEIPTSALLFLCRSWLHSCHWPWILAAECDVIQPERSGRLLSKWPMATLQQRRHRQAPFALIFRRTEPSVDIGRVKNSAGIDYSAVELQFSRESSLEQ